MLSLLGIRVFVANYINKILSSLKKPSNFLLKERYIATGIATVKGSSLLAVIS